MLHKGRYVSVNQQLRAAPDQAAAQRKPQVFDLPYWDARATYSDSLLEPSHSRSSILVYSPEA